MSDADIIRRQAARIGVLEEQVRQLNERLIAKEKLQFPHEWRLEPSEVRLLSILHTSKGFVPYELLESRIPKHADIGNPRNLVTTRICWLRHKLKPYGIEFVTRWGQGIELPAASRRIIREAIAAQA